MGKIHMEPPQVRDLARRMEQTAGDLYNQSRTLQRCASRLPQVWEGGRSASHQRDFQRYLRALDQAVDDLQELALRVGREADQWEAADGDGLGGSGLPSLPGRWPGGGWFPFPPGYPGGWYPFPPSGWLPGRMVPPYGIPVWPWDSILPYYPPSSLYPWISLPPFGFPWLTPILAVNSFLDSHAKEEEWFAGWDGDLSERTKSKGWHSERPEFLVEKKWILAEGQVYDDQDTHGDLKFLNWDIGNTTNDVKHWKYEAGAKAGVGEKGVNFGAYGELTAYEATGVAVVGTSMLGITVSETITAGSIEGFAGIRENSLGASIGVSAGGAEKQLGINIAGVNIGVGAGLDAGIGAGFQIGAKTKAKLGPFRIGLYFSKAKE